MAKVDWKRVHKHLYRPSRSAVSEVVVPPLRYLMVDGQGDPNTATAYREAVEALFSVSYTAKFLARAQTGEDYVVMPLEGLWWAEDHSVFVADDRAGWQWTMMIHQPAVATDAVVDSAVETVRRKKGLPGLDRLRLETFDEGRCAQLLHVGPFHEEGPVIQRVHDYIEERSALRGKHHEIYLSDLRRAAPENWRTVIRQPMA